MIDFARLTLTDIKVAEIATTSLDVDAYIGMAFASPAGAQGQGCIVVKDPVQGGFVELSISLASGRLVGATLVGRPSNVMAGNPLPYPKRQSKGLPLLAKHGFETDDLMPRTELLAALQINVTHDSAYIFWSATPADHRVDCGRAFFTFAKGQLTGFGGTNLTAAELDALSNSMA